MATRDPGGTVVPIDESDFTVASGDPDVRGWDIMASDGRRIGKVNNLLVDTAAKKVRYLDVKVDDDLVGDDGRDRHILVPIGYAQLDRDDSRVHVEALASTDVRSVPAYRQEPVTREYETSLRSHYEPGYTAGATTDRDFYEHEHYDDRRFYEGRRGTQGAREGEARVTLSEEELVVEKRAVPKEELVIRKEQVQETQTVEADLRKERAEVHREGDVNVRDDRTR